MRPDCSHGEEAMRKNRSVGSVTPVLLLIAALALLGSHRAEAKKPQPEPESEWQVMVPSCGSLEGGNLCTWGDPPVYTDTGEGDPVAVDVGSFRDRETRQQMSLFTLVVFNCEWGGDCWAPSLPQITLRGIEFWSSAQDEDEGTPPCIFPEALILDCDFPPDCLECFVNGEHPHWGEWPDWKDKDDYRWFYFRVRVPGDFAEMQEGEMIETPGELEMAVRADNEFLATGYENEHIFRAYGELPDVTVTITRVGDAWTVVAEGQMTFYEAYRGCGRRNPQGDCVGTWAYVYPLWGISYPLTFETTWTSTIP
jgi:hypothetical protein